MGTQTKNYLKTVAEKNKDGILGSDISIGVSSVNVVDTRDGKTPYRLSQFIDNYLSFMNENVFVYSSDDGVVPVNQHIGVWIDGSVDGLGNPVKK